MTPPRRIAVLSTASACGKTTLARALSARLGAPHVELDALVHGPGWRETSDADLLAALAPVFAAPAWIIDGNYRGKLGDAVVSRADLVVWLDLPRWVWLLRLIRRTLGRAARREVLWNGNRESLRNAFVGRDSLVAFALSNDRRRQAEWPAWLAPFAVRRLRSPREVAAFLAEVGS